MACIVHVYRNAELRFLAQCRLLAELLEPLVDNLPLMLGRRKVKAGAVRDAVVDILATISGIMAEDYVTPGLDEMLRFAAELLMRSPRDIPYLYKLLAKPSDSTVVRTTGYTLVIELVGDTTVAEEHYEDMEPDASLPSLLDSEAENGEPVLVEPPEFPRIHGHT